MKIVLQRVKKAKVTHDQNEICHINDGIMLLVGFQKEENVDILNRMVRKILNAKIFGRWEKSVVEMEYEILVLSQFTLFGKLKGRKLDFHVAEEHNKAKILFENMVDSFKKEYSMNKVKCGLFGMHLEINLVNDGPVTLIFDES